MESCPRCGYRLHGLPAQGRCPECGLDYDPDSRVLRLAPGRRHWHNLAYAGLLLALLALAGPTTGFRREDGAFVAIVIGCAAVGIWRLVRTAGKTCELVINRFGATFRHPTVCKDTIPWTLIRQARCSPLRRRLYLEAHDRGCLVSCKYDWLGGAAMARECRDAINTSKCLYARRCGEPPLG
jgi:hypothetical protein